MRRLPPSSREIDDYRDSGIDEVLLTVPHTTRDEVLTTLDHYAKSYGIR
ncbi:hypothetical protein [Embleya sp. NBC_00896]|nr:hypothetical protein OG928_27640 [Embleya sp. NBC_00896]